MKTTINRDRLRLDRLGVEGGHVFMVLIIITRNACHRLVMRVGW